MSSSKKEIDWLIKEKYPRFLEEPKKYLPKIRRDVRRLENGEPLAYVIGWVDFLGCKIDLSQRPLIPRPETEWWVEQAIRHVAEGKSRMRILDAFAGSGCVGIALLKRAKNVVVDFTDNASGALKQIKINAKLNHISGKRFRVIKSDVLNKAKGEYDYVFANPPYIPMSRKSRLPKSVLGYEPHSALFGGKDGLRYIRGLLTQTKKHLVAGGELWLEFDSEQAASVRRISRQRGYHCDIRRDQFRRPRYAVLDLPRTKNSFP